MASLVDFLIDIEGGGARPDIHDFNDEYYQFPAAAQVPRTVDLRNTSNPHTTPIYNQYVTQSCTANAAAAAFWYTEKAAQRDADWGDAGPSRRFIYWLARLDKDPKEDKGSCMRDAIKSMAQFGVCPEADCKFPDIAAIEAEVASAELQTEDEKTQMRKDLKDKIINEKPNVAAFENALSHKITKYQRLDLDLPEAEEKAQPFAARERFGQDNLRRLRHCIAEGYPVAFSLWYYIPQKDACMMMPNGDYVLKDVWKEPAASAKKILFPRHTYPEDLEDRFRYHDNNHNVRDLGAHSVLAIGYDDDKEQVLVQNSRGPEFGNHGYFFVPYSWISDFAATNDFWTIRVGDQEADTKPLLWQGLLDQIFGGAIDGSKT